MRPSVGLSPIEARTSSSSSVSTCMSKESWRPSLSGASRGHAGDEAYHAGAPSSPITHPGGADRSGGGGHATGGLRGDSATVAVNVLLANALWRRVGGGKVGGTGKDLAPAVAIKERKGLLKRPVLLLGDLHRQTELPEVDHPAFESHPSSPRCRSLSPPSSAPNLTTVVKLGLERGFRAAVVDGRWFGNYR